MSEQTREQKIMAAERIDQFLLDEHVSGALAALERQYIEELVEAPHSEDRARAQSKVKVMRAFKEELRRIVAVGTDELFMQVLQERQAELKRSLLL